MIDTDKLLAIQEELHDQLVKEHHLENEDLLPNTILALMVEVGEMANEWRGFKHWSHDREPRVVKKVRCEECEGTGNLYWDVNYTDQEKKYLECGVCKGFGKIKINPLLEEFVDGLSFIYELWIISNFEAVGRKLNYYTLPRNSRITITERLLDLYKRIHNLCGEINHDSLSVLYSNYLYIGSLFGFKPEQIEQAFIEKKKVNYQRIEEGY